MWTLWFSPPEKTRSPNTLSNSKVEVLIGGSSFGEFEPTMDELFSQIEDSSSSARKVFRFHREFVSRPSLYNWAENTSKELLNVYEVEVREVGISGRNYRRLRMLGCRPLNWMISERDLMGNFYEEVVIVAQKVDSVTAGTSR